LLFLLTDDGNYPTREQRWRRELRTLQLRGPWIHKLSHHLNYCGGYYANKDVKHLMCFTKNIIVGQMKSDNNTLFYFVFKLSFNFYFILNFIMINNEAL